MSEQRSTYFIWAHDMWMFRDSKPFNAQQNFVANSTFPPNPQVVTGFLRGHILELSNTSIPKYIGGTADANLERIIGTPEKRSGSLRVHNIHVGRMMGDKVDMLYPVPNDLLVDKYDENQFTVAKPQEQDFITNAPFEGWQPLMVDGNNYEGASGWLDEANMQAYLTGESVTKAIKREALVMTDERIGLAIDPRTKTALESYLYHARFVRPHAQTPYKDDTPEAKYDPNAITGIFVTISGDEGAMGESGIIATGGEGRFAYYRKVHAQPLQQNVTGNVKIILQTPAYFSGGWQPHESVGWQQWLGEEARLVSFAISGAEYISGWNMATKTPRPMRRLVPAGSVFYFEGVNKMPIAFTDEAINYPFSHMGFGSYLATTWKTTD